MNSEESELKGTGTAEDPYQIGSAAALAEFAQRVNTGELASAYAVLTADIDLSEICSDEKDTSWTPIGNAQTVSGKTYKGSFDGQGHSVKNLYIAGSETVGLFGYIGSSGTVQNLRVSGSITNTSHTTGGGVVAINDGRIENCCSSVTIIATATGNNAVTVGGVVGLNAIGSSVTNCCNSSSVSGTGSGSGPIFVGGVVGQNAIGSSVTNCYNTGGVSGSGGGPMSGSGGVVGWNANGSVTNCYFLQTADVNKDLQGIGNGIGSGTGTATEKDDTAFHSGEVAYLLQDGQTDGSSQVWGQDLKTENSWPTLIALDKNVQPVYQVTVDYNYNGAPSNATIYTNGTEPDESPIRDDGYVFVDWIESKRDDINKTITYTAKWEPYTYSIGVSPAVLDFGSINEGDAQPAAQTVTVTNTGNQTVTLNQPASTNSFVVGTLSTTELAPNAIASFTIQPKDKLPRGSYSEQITISGNDGASATLTATFTVKEPPYTGKYSYEVFTSVGDNGSLTVDRYATEGDKVTIEVAPDEAYLLDELVVTAGGKDVELTDNHDGTYTFTMPSADVKITATFAEDPDWTEPEEPATDVSEIFIDIAANAWYRDAVQYAYDNGLMTGVSANEFAPEQTTTRAMIVSMLARLEGVESANNAGFADVSNEWYATAVNWAASVGVVNGYEDGTFKPNTAITREQLAAILMNYAQYKGQDVSARADLNGYTDQPSTWAEEAMQWAVAEELIIGVTNDELQPQSSATRAQVAAILQRFLAE